MIRALDAVLLRTCETELAAPAYPAGEADSDNAAEFDVITTSFADGYDAANAFVAANVRKFYGCYGTAIGTGSRAVFGVEICCRHRISWLDWDRRLIRSLRGLTNHFDRRRYRGLWPKLHFAGGWAQGSRV